MKTKKIDKKQISIKNFLVCLNTFKNLSNFFTNLSKTAKIYVKKFGYFKKVLYLCIIKLTQKNKIMKTQNLTAEEKAAKAAAKRERAALKEQKYCEFLEKKEKELLATLTPLENKEIVADIKFLADFYREYTNSKGNKIIEYYELDENANPDEHSLLKVYSIWTAYDEKGRKKIEISYYNHFENNLNAAWLAGSKIVYSYNDDGSYTEKHYLNYAANTREGVQERWVLVFTDFFDKDGGLIKKEVNNIK